MDTNVLDWLEVTAAACPDKPAFLDEDGAVTFADVRREARIIGTAAARLRAGRKAPIAVMSGRNAHTRPCFSARYTPAAATRRWTGRCPCTGSTLF